MMIDRKMLTLGIKHKAICLLHSSLNCLFYNLNILALKMTKLDKNSNLFKIELIQTLKMDSSGPVMKCKIVFLGDQSVGKTSIINRFIFDNFTGNEQPTVGVDFVSKTINVENKTLRMQLWDTAGQERFHSLIPSYIKDSHAAIIVYDITNQVSYGNINKWVEDVKEVRGEQAAIFILGNKTDLESERKVSTAEATKKIQQLGLSFSEVSAKTGGNIKDFFKNLAQSIAGVNKKTPNATQKPQSPKAMTSQSGGGKHLVNPNTNPNPAQNSRRRCC